MTVAASNPDRWPTTLAEFERAEQWCNETLPRAEYQSSCYSGKAMFKQICTRYPRVWLKPQGWDWEKLEVYFQKRFQVEASTRDARSKGRSEPSGSTVGGKARKDLPRLKAELWAKLSTSRVTHSSTSQGRYVSSPNAQALPSTFNIHEGKGQVRTPQPQSHANLKRKLETDQTQLSQKRAKVTIGQEPLPAPRPHVPMGSTGSFGLAIPQIPQISNMGRSSTPASAGQLTRVSSVQGYPFTSVSSPYAVPRGPQQSALGAASNPQLNPALLPFRGATPTLGVQAQNNNGASGSLIPNSQLHRAKQRFNTEILEAPPQQEMFSDQGPQNFVCRESSPMFGVQGVPAQYPSTLAALTGMSQGSSAFSGARGTPMANANPKSQISLPNVVFGAPSIPGATLRANQAHPALVPAGFMSGPPSASSYTSAVPTAGAFPVSQQQQPPPQLSRMGSISQPQLPVHISHFSSVNQRLAALASEMNLIPGIQQAIDSRLGTQTVTGPEVIDLTSPLPATECALGSEDPPVPMIPAPASAPVEPIGPPEPRRSPTPASEVVDKAPEPAIPLRPKVYLPLELEDLFKNEFLQSFVTKDVTGSEITWGPVDEDEESSTPWTVGDSTTPADPSTGVVDEQSKYFFPIALLDLSAGYRYELPSPSTPPPPGLGLQSAVA